MHGSTTLFVLLGLPSVFDELFLLKFFDHFEIFVSQNSGILNVDPFLLI